MDFDFFGERFWFFEFSLSSWRVFVLVGPVGDVGGPAVNQGRDHVSQGRQGQVDLCRLGGSTWVNRTGFGFMQQQQ